jgi:hypothetical protein
LRPPQDRCAGSKRKAKSGVRLPPPANVPYLDKRDDGGIGGLVNVPANLPDFDECGISLPADLPHLDKRGDGGIGGLVNEPANLRHFDECGFSKITKTRIYQPISLTLISAAMVA